MPTIIQLPPLHGEEEKSSSNGVPAPLPLKADPFAVDERLHYVPFALLEAQMEENQRLRMREAFWISVVVHAIALVSLYFLLPRLLATHRSILTPLEAMMQNHDITFVELPPTPQQKPPQNTNKISDQNRIAALRHPDQKLLKELLDAHPPGAPGKVAPPVPASNPAAQQPASPAAQQSQAQQASQKPSASAPPIPAQQNGQTPQTMARNQGSSSSPFSTPRSAASQLEEAMRASAANRGYSGNSGDYGPAPTAQSTNLRNNYDVLSDTMGVDFGPYLNRALAEVREHWYEIIPEEARSPLMKQGKVSIQFVIMKDGSVAGMKAVAPSGDVALDRAAWGGITASNPFQPLPKEFRGEYLVLRLHFLYNPDRGDLR